VSIQTISQEEFAKLDLNAIQLLDVRTPNEISRGTINGAVEINLFDHDFTERVLSKFEKDQPLYIYCAAGGRSGKACSKLVLEGFDEVYNLQGGYSEWVQLQKE
jgi:rhodanese-related sulfurtransferase